jgi:hypothetical protein
MILPSTPLGLSPRSERFQAHSKDPPRGACGNVRRVPEASFGLSNRASTWTVSPAGGTDETSDFIVDDAISAASEVVRRCGADKSDHRHCRLLCACPSGQTAATPPSRHLLRRLQEVGEARCCARSRLMGDRNAIRSIETAGIHFPARRCDGVSLAAQAQQPERVRSSECCPPSIGTLSAFNRNRRPR